MHFNNIDILNMSTFIALHRFSWDYNIESIGIVNHNDVIIDFANVGSVSQQRTRIIQGFKNAIAHYRLNSNTLISPILIKEAKGKKGKYVYKTFFLIYISKSDKYLHEMKGELEIILKKEFPTLNANLLLADPEGEGDKPFKYLFLVIE